MTHDQNTVLVIGLPEAGKTTFLAALWHLAESEEVGASLVLHRLSEDAKHLNHIKGAWLQHTKVGRTNPNSEQTVSMLFRERDGAKMGTVVFPDLSGETFRQQWTDRCWTREYAELVGRAVGAILFIHPSQITAPFTIAQAHQMLSAADPIPVTEAQARVQSLFTEEEREELGDHDPSGVLDPPSDGSKREGTDRTLPLADWSADKASPQVQLVELLQFLAARAPKKDPIRIAVIVSAWDTIEDITAEHVPGDARAWIRIRTPLLHQYLDCNGDKFNSSFYAMSAQGGDTKDPKCLQRWRDTHLKSERIFIAGPNCSPHDITEPVRRVLGFRD